MSENPELHPSPPPVPKCELCAKTFDESEMLRFGELWVCANCKPAYVQRLYEGATRPLFRDLTGLTRWVRGLFITNLVILALGMVQAAIELILLIRSNGVTTDAIEWHAAGQLVFGLVASVPGTALVILFLRWTYLANLNARTLGAEGMRFSPGWSVGWHFIPFANLWMPYRAMQEIWQASSAPHHWQGAKTPAILPWWWALRVAVILLNIPLAIVTFRSSAPAEMIAAAGFYLFCYVPEFPLTILAMKVVSKIWQAQLQTRGGTGVS